MTHASVPADQREALGISDTLVSFQYVTLCLLKRSDCKSRYALKYLF